ncbi:hypothetical protein [Sulfurospirillum barnesii]|uniref:Periplasmic protein n=1 Tax=Sulfurospirillum barnesii (strain ATCC 700032 / DSM 10660 / SES-3) TaxID=760154 RepID=I3XWE1_SULBS|nr:hypothetical protein [Sulfurospirillum barnesii]AFL68265.1 hypothetical protein Sulba_0964 [Sulfurospirillum barnesii SES-3]
MKKLLILVGLLTSMYAIPPCELPDEKVCMYLYKGGMNAEIIITNLSTDTVLVTYASASLDGNSKTIRNLKLSSGQTFTMLQSRYKTYDQKPYYHINSFEYKALK